jgi:ribosome recycling factor|uniref:Ribosome-recycling factor n=1 Tax=candidate division WOR-3 bacterium TaxID=2052148 RepID=A0A7C3Z3F6_UNCW3
MLEALYKETREKMQKSLDLLATEFSRIRTSRANPALLDGIKVNYYNALVPLKQIASIVAPEPKLLVIQPWDKNAIPEIEKAIQKAELGLNPQVEANVIRIPIPPLTEERRKELVKLISRLAEETRVAIRNIRRDANETIKRMEKNKEISEDDSKVAMKKIQEITDESIRSVDELVKKKEKEILEI